VDKYIGESARLIREMFGKPVYLAWDNLRHYLVYHCILLTLHLYISESTSVYPRHCTLAAFVEQLNNRNILSVLLVVLATTRSTRLSEVYRIENS